MPALFWHYKLGNDVLNNTKDNIKKEINSNIKYYNMYNQGWDNLYYHFPKWKYYKHLGFKAHKNNINEFFKNAIDYIHNNNLENDSKYTNLIYGILNHYIMDTIIHPYINYQKDYLNMSHTAVEFMLDSHIGKNINFKELIPKVKFDNNYLSYINYIFLNTYNINNIGKIWNRSHNNGYIIYKYFINDKYGIKTFFYRFIDLFNHSDFKFHNNTLYIKKFDKRLLNNNHLKWHNPNNKEEIYNYSFNELYNIVLKISLKMNYIAYNVIHNNKDINILLNYINKINICNIKELLH